MSVTHGASNSRSTYNQLFIYLYPDIINGAHEREWIKSPLEWFAIPALFLFAEIHKAKGDGN